METPMAAHTERTEKLTGSAKSIRLVDYSNMTPGLMALHFDTPNEKVNKLDQAFMWELNQQLELLKTRSDIKALIIFSDKESIFVAGADIRMIQNIKSSQEGTQMASSGQSVIQKIEEFSFPTIAAVHGACMGGGTELALCCSNIVVSDGVATKIALPEVNLGVLPGFGGTVRLPKRIGLQTAMDYILSGKTMDGNQAFKLGFANACFPFQNFKNHVLQYATRLIHREKMTGYKSKSFMAKLVTLGLEKNPLGRKVLFSKARKMILSKTHGHYPAPLKILEVLEKNQGRSKKAALATESEAFGELAVTDVSKRLIELFFATEKVKKQTGVTNFALNPKDRINSVGLLGAGVMGGGIAQLIAHRGLPIRIKDIDYKALGSALTTARKLFLDLVKKRKMRKEEMDIKFALISPTVDYSGFSRTDIVIEAVVENMDVKKKVLKEIEPQMQPNEIFATNTSSLLVTELATVSQRPENVVGIHFFNPVHRMPLIEVVRAQKTSDRAVAQAFEFSKRLGKTPIVVKDGPGFLVNRLLMPYLNEASFLMAEGVPIESLDEAVFDFGMPMGPATLLDEIGIDVAVKVAKILHLAFGARAVPCGLNDKLVEAKLLGRKSGKGFYLYDSQGKKQGLNPEIYGILGLTPTVPTEEQKQSWIPRMLYLMVNEAARCLQEGIVLDSQEVDLGMILGTGFPPFRGGLLHYADSVGLDNIVASLETFSKTIDQRFTPSQPLVEMVQQRKTFYSN